ncbi:MAG: N-6 DNA methylase [Sphingobacteriales bacterium]|nr:N-6 DNA methylase [Sphingobacteriales bacterium]
MNERCFAEDHERKNKNDQGIKNKYRYTDNFKISKDEVIDLFKDIPFLNGGLFDCLDKFDEEKLEKGKKEQIFVDGFTRIDGKQAIVPDYLFFGEETEVDLNETYGTRGKRYVTKGLIGILNSYKFTVAENTPIEEEIALDPELLGKVFENLLASYNPETKTTARKQTGSFYTPREIVNYMVDESLIEYLKSVVSISAHEKESSFSIPAHELNQKQDAFETFFNPNNEIQIHTGNLPHWQQESVWYFVTFRLADSIPAEVAEQIKAEREVWLKKNKKNEKGEYTKEQIKEYYRLFSDRIESLLNNGKGSCILKNPEISKIVADAFNHFNNQRYVLDDWVIMPNHVHILLRPLGENKMPDILHSWKSFTANEINKVTGNKGQLWMHESYDHIVRNEKALNAIRNYIRQNPVKANLKQGEYLLSRSKDASDTFEVRLRKLFSYNDEGNPFNPEETDKLIEAINNAKILDPACGSGAFPMGVLHKMVYLLQKLDPGNVKWKAQQKEKIIGNQIKELEKDKKAIEGLSDKAVREKAIQAVDERLKEIDEIFESKNYFDDYARKLYLIENCIYGIDIQPIAVQISKLRFFISLIIDQDKDPKKENLGFRSLPNLETKFVAANTLISLEIPTTDLFSENNTIKLLQEQLKATRHAYFNAKTREEKLDLKKQDKELRKKIAAQISDTLINKKEDEIKNLEKQLSEAKKKLVQIEAAPEQKETIESTNIFGETETTVIDKKKEKIKTQKSTISFIEKQINLLKAADNKDTIQKVAQQISSFDPYDQNHFANWFEPEWMFGNDVKDGFDIVIGNPPYITYKGKEVVDISDAEVKQLIALYHNSAEYKVNSYALFTERGVNLLSVNGTLSFIIPSTILQNEYLKKIRKYLITKYHISQIVSFANKVFEAVTDSIILFTKNKHSKDLVTIAIRKSDLDFLNLEDVKTYSQSTWNDEKNDFVINLKTNKNEDLILAKIETDCEYVDDYLEVYVGIVANGIKKFLSTSKRDSNHKKYLQGKHIENFELKPEKLFINFLKDELHSNTDESVYLQKEKILVRKTGNRLIAAIDFEKYYTDQSIYNLYPKIGKTINLKVVTGLLNSNLLEYYFNKKMITNPDVFPYIKGIHLKKLPLKFPKSKSEESKFESLVLKITEMKANGEDATTEIMKLNQMVYQLYDLTEEEIAIIENSINKTPKENG